LAAGLTSQPPERSSARGFEPLASSPPDPRLVIFTADDFGLSEALNAAVALAHLQGVLGAASLMPAGPAAAQALELARELPDLCLGVHLTLIQGRAVLPPQHLPHLVDAQGQFPHHPVATGWRYFFQPHLLPEIRRELAAQIEAMLAAHLPPWHLNSHLNLHLHPRIFPMVADLAREYRVPWVRLPREDWRATLSLAPDHPLPKLAQGLIFTWLCRRARRRARAAGLRCNDYLFGLLNDGRMTEDFYLGLVPRLQPGVTEIYSHPALYPDPELRRWAPQYRRREELAALLSPGLREALAAAGVIVSNFREVCQLRGGRGSDAAP
jgi:hopanoid biosynthesis associated protein HpnK